MCPLVSCVKDVSRDCPVEIMGCCVDADVVDFDAYSSSLSC